MIDLLPNDVKSSRMYGRRNRLLARWNFYLFLAIAAILAIIGAGYFFINNATLSAADVKTKTEDSIKAADLSNIEKEYETFTSNLKTVVQILNNQVLFSELLQQIGGVTPTGAILNTVSLSDSDNALDLNFTTTSASIAAQIQVNLEDPTNELFEKADIIQVACYINSDDKEECSVQLRALFKEDAKFLFLNSVDSGATP